MTDAELRIPVQDAPPPGEVRLLELAGHPIGLYQVGGNYYAVADRCPHRGAPLCSSGRVVRGIQLDRGIAVQGAALGLLRCPWHKWDFEIATGRCLVHSRLRIRRYRVEQQDNELRISLKHPVDLARHQA
jgi:nitrite reductase (NADH) small subunit